MTKEEDKFPRTVICARCGVPHTVIWPTVSFICSGCGLLITVSW